MKISRRDALTWFRFFAELPPEEGLMPKQQEIVWAVLSQLETAVDKRIGDRLAGIGGLKSLEGRTLYVGPDERFPQGCRSCLMGTGLTAVRRTNRCNLNCPFCYDFGELDRQPPVGEGMWEIGGTRFRVEDLDLLLRVGRRPTGVTYVYLEPFMEIELYYPVIERFRREGIHQHMYTNGTLVTRQNLKALGEAGLDELRFNLGASGCAGRVIEAMAAAGEYIPQVGIETPMTPQFLEAFLRREGEILATGLDFMNCAELHLNPNNLGNYFGEPLYCTRQGYISPVWSREITMELMKRAADNAWPIVVHDCSNMTKFARDLNLRAHESGWFGASSYGAEFDVLPYEAFLPVLESGEVEFIEEEELPEDYRPGGLW